MIEDDGDDGNDVTEDVTTALRTALHGEPGEELGRIKVGASAFIVASWHATPRPGGTPYLALALHVRRRDGSETERHTTRLLRFEAGRELRQLGAAVVRALERAERRTVAPENEAEK